MQPELLFMPLKPQNQQSRWHELFISMNPLARLGGMLI